MEPFEELVLYDTDPEYMTDVEKEMWYLDMLMGGDEDGNT